MIVDRVYEIRTILNNGKRGTTLRTNSLNVHGPIFGAQGQAPQALGFAIDPDRIFATVGETGRVEDFRVRDQEEEEAEMNQAQEEDAGAGNEVDMGQQGGKDDEEDNGGGLMEGGGEEMDMGVEDHEADDGQNQYGQRQW
jgi:hypothetical protein